MLTEEHNQLGVDGHRTGLAARAVLEFAALPGGAGVGPPGAAAWLGVGQDQLPPAVVGEVLARFSGRSSTASSGRSAA